MRQPPDLELDIFPPFEGFPKEGLRFLRSLKKNNNRDWFQKNKPVYEECVKLPMQSLIAALQQPMRTIAPEIEINPKRNIFRIYRDVRFSKDKSPYKTHVAAVFHVRGLAWERSAGFYVHVEPGEVYVGGGVYMPSGDQIKLIRQAIASQPAEFLSIVKSAKFRKEFKELEGEKLTRVPKGYEPDDPMGEWLKHKSFYTGVVWNEKEALSAGFVKNIVKVYQDLLPLIRFLNKALGTAR